jgi:two-component system sensor histidine kinase KdpD
MSQPATLSIKSAALLLWRVSRSFACVAVITFLYFQIIPVNTLTVALTMLLAILAMASWWGLLEAIAASFMGALCFNLFFLPPILTLTIADPQNWVALFAFLCTAVAGSQLSTSVKRKASEALMRQREMERLYELSKALMLVEKESPIAGQVAQHIVRIFEIPGIAVFDRDTDCVYRVGAEIASVSDNRLRDAAMQGTGFQDEAMSMSVLPLRLGGNAIGSIAVAGGAISDAATQAIGNLAAITIEKARAEDVASRVEAARQNEAMKATLLDALAHEFMTPLTSIKAAASSIPHEQPASQQELISVIEEETDRLESLVRETIRTARIEAGNLRLRKLPLSVRELVGSTLENLKRLVDDRKIQIDVPPDVPCLLVDAELAELALRQVIANALKYSSPESPIRIQAHSDNNQVIISVRDQGPGITEKELRHIFEKFYRVGERTDGVPGTGMGLHIAREIVKAHGGEISVKSTVGEGSEFFLSLPCALEDVEEPV